MRCTLCGLTGHVRDDHMVLTAAASVGMPLSQVERAIAIALGVAFPPGGSTP